MPEEPASFWPVPSEEAGYTAEDLAIVPQSLIDHLRGVATERRTLADRLLAAFIESRKNAP